MIVGTNMTFFPMFFLGEDGMSPANLAISHASRLER